MAWIESHQTLRKHPKTRALMRELGLSRVEAIGHLHCLWWWVLDYAEDGDLSRFAADEIAEGAEWEGDPDVFVAAMIAAGFIDQADRAVHHWHEFAGKLVDRRASNAARMREKREREKLDRGRAVHVPRTVQDTCTDTDAARAGLPYPTVPNTTNTTEPTKRETREAVVEAPHGAAPLAPVRIRPVPKVPAVPSEHREMLRALVDAFYEPNSDAEWARFGTAAKALLKARPAATVEEVPDLVVAFEDAFPGATCTPLALFNNLGRLRHPTPQKRGAPKRESAMEQSARINRLRESGGAA